MVDRGTSCCGGKKPDKKKQMDIPEAIQKELDQIGGFRILADRIPAQTDLEERSRIYHALSDPLRLTILYLIKDQPLCVCVINQFIRIADSKLSYHLTILKESGLIKGEYSGNWIIYSLTERSRKYLN